MCIWINYELSTLSKSESTWYYILNFGKHKLHGLILKYHKVQIYSEQEETDNAGLKDGKCKDIPLILHRLRIHKSYDEHYQICPSVIMYLKAYNNSLSTTIVRWKTLPERLFTKKQITSLLALLTCFAKLCSMSCTNMLHLKEKCSL
jgi:hypothetical protein